MDLASKRPDEVRVSDHPDGIDQTRYQLGRAEALKAKELSTVQTTPQPRPDGSPNRSRIEPHITFLSHQL